MNRIGKVIIIDIEASGLHSGSYPTEIAWIDPMNDDKVTSYLIQPTRRWLDRKWDYHAQAITGISQKMIVNDGMPLREVAKLVKEMISQSDYILSDAPEFDRDWTMELFESAFMDYPVREFTEFHQFIRGEFGKTILLDGESVHRAGKDVERMASAFNTARINC